MENAWYSALHHSDYLETRMCERCPEKVEYDSRHTLCGCVEANICRICNRELETDPKARELAHQKSRINVKINAFIQAGDAVSADDAWLEYNAAEQASFEYAVAWLQQRPTRGGKTREQVIEDKAEQEPERVGWRKRLDEQSVKSMGKHLAATAARESMVREAALEHGEDPKADAKAEREEP